MGQVSIASPIARSDLIVIVLRLPGQVAIPGATSVYRIRSTQSGARSRGWLLIRRRRSPGRHSTSDGLKVVRALTRFRAMRAWKLIYALLLKESCSGWMLSFVVR